ncbi:MAG TPA: 2-phospho-L-lactate guanylyltransferase [Candidatus Limnocylindria bacterium]|jgi:2-phospho-L-lactate guanylyltransferase
MSGPAVVVLARDPRRAKTRLRGTLSPADRERLATAMFDDVLLAAKRTGWSVLVVTDSRTVAARARAAGVGAAVLTPRGTRDAARRGLSRAAVQGATAAVVIAADLPLLRAADLRRIAAAGRRHRAVIVPDRHRHGTNALYVRPPSALAPRFGRGSFAAHRAAAGSSGAALVVAGVGFDVDTASDLRELRRLRRRAGPHTRGMLKKTTTKDIRRAT